MWRSIRSLFRVLAYRNDFEHGMDDELRFHIEQYTEELLRSGLSPEEASRRARIEFGGLNSVKADCRQARGLQLLDELSRELRYALRLLRKTPGFTITALLTLAVCVGANLTIFAAIDSVLLRPLPFPEPAQLVTVFNTYPKAGVDRDGSSLTNYYERRGHIPAFRSLSIYRYETAIIGQPRSVERQEVMAVSPDFFSTLGVGLVKGRNFSENETTYEINNVAILTDSYWRSHFNADPHVLGRQIRVDSRPLTVIGVLPSGFHFLSSEARLYVPLASRLEARSPSQRHSGGNVIQMIARLKPRATIAEAQSQIDAQNTALEADDPQAKMMADAGFRSLVVSLRGDHVAAIRPTLLLLQAGVLLLLLIGTVNLANLLLIRANARVKEHAVRRALGASRSQVVSEAVTEATLLTSAGGLLGLAVAAGGIRLLASSGAERLPLGSDIAFHGRLALVGLAAAIVMGIALAVPIAWFNLRGQVEAALKSESRGGTIGHAAQRLRHLFTVAQIALSFVLLAGAGLLGVSLNRTMAVSPGFQADRVLSAQISLIGEKYPSPAAGLAFSETLVNNLTRQPGVSFAGVVNNIPFSGHSGKSAAYVVGHTLRPGESPRGHYSYGVGGDYFQAMGFSLWEGRFLTAADSRRQQRVCVVDRDFARYYWPDGSALGHRLFQGSDPGSDADAFTVVGVVGAVKQAGLTEDGAQGAVYYPYIHRPDSHIFVVARARVSLGSLGLTLQKVVRQIDPELAVDDIRPMDARITDSLAVRRAPALLAILFSAIALLLTAIGTYGVLSYAVAQRRREIGVRMALGARPEQIYGHFFLLALRLLAGGATLGLIGAWLTGPAMHAVLFHVRPFDATTLAGAAAIVSAVSLGACLLPARQAARISPMEALADS
jgi:putative ABC transport system permease protein